MTLQKKAPTIVSAMTGVDANSKHRGQTDSKKRFEKQARWRKRNPKAEHKKMASARTFCGGKFGIDADIDSAGRHGRGVRHDRG